MMLKYGNGVIELEKTPTSIVVLSNGFNIQNVENPNEVLDEARADGEVATHVYSMFVEDSLAKAHVIPNGNIYLSNLSTADVKDISEKWNLKLLERLGESHVTDNDSGYVYSVTKESRNPITVCYEIQSMYPKAIAEPELIHDPVLFYYQWHLENLGLADKYPANFYKKGEDIKAKSAWKSGNENVKAKIKVAVIDDAFDLAHEALKNVQDAYSFKNGNSNVAPSIGEFHGTSCLGLAIANGEVLGTCPDCIGIPVQFYYISDSMVESMFNYCIDKGAKVISCSWGASDSKFQLSTRMYNAIKKASEKAIILFAAGNSSVLVPEGSFAGHPDVLCVGAYTSKGSPSSFSNYGSLVDFVAPSNGAAGITTTDTLISGYEDGAYTFGFGGTSASTPIAAGSISFAWALNPSLDIATMKRFIFDSCDKSFPTFSKFGKLDQEKLVGYVKSTLTNIAPPGDSLNGTEITKTIEPNKAYFIYNYVIEKDERYGVTLLLEKGDYKITLFDASTNKANIDFTIKHKDKTLYTSTAKNRSETYILKINEDAEYVFIFYTDAKEKLSFTINSL